MLYSYLNLDIHRGILLSSIPTNTFEQSLTCVLHVPSIESLICDPNTLNVVS
jgi:hypothetical protein